MNIKKLNEELAKFVEDWPDNKEFEALFDQYVPDEGHADTVGGELIRAVNKIVYRYYNDGDRVGVGYGNETCNPAARFIETNTKLEPLASKLWDYRPNEEYEKVLADLMQETIKICKEDNLFNKPNTDDMNNYTDPIDSKWEEDEEEWYDYSDDWEDEEYEEEEE